MTWLWIALAFIGGGVAAVVILHWLFVRSVGRAFGWF